MSTMRAVTAEVVEIAGERYLKAWREDGEFHKMLSHYAPGDPLVTKWWSGGGKIQSGADRAVIALDRIQAILSGTEWGSETLDQVADAVRSTGRTVADAGAPSPGHEDPLLVCPRLGFASFKYPGEPYVVTSLRKDNGMVAILTRDGTTRGYAATFLANSGGLGAVAPHARRLLDTLTQPYRVVGPAELLEYVTRPDFDEDPLL